MSLVFDIGLRKKELRSAMLAKRRASSAGALEELSVLAQQNLIRQEGWFNARSVALYISTKNEVSTRLLLEAAAAGGKRVFLPRVREKSAGLMDFAICAGEHELQVGAYDIREPDPALCPGCVFAAPESCPESALSALAPYSWSEGENTEQALQAQTERPGIAPPPDLFVIPGVAFDRRGRRLGFGGGFYDRFLANPLLREYSFFVGLAYSFQLLDEVPAESWDQPLDAICTDSEYLTVASQISEDNNG